MKKQTIFIFSGPGGAGKTTIVNELFKDADIAAQFMKAVAVTSRSQRPQEEEGKDYFFVSKEEFIYLKNHKFFLESESVADNYYGTPKLFQNIAQRFKRCLVLCIDVKGAMDLKKKVKTNKIVTIFITAPNEADLMRRMKKRCDNVDEIEKRKELAKKELQFSKYYDYVIINKTIKAAVKKAKEIILAHR